MARAAATKKKQPGETKELAALGLQNYTMEKIHRRQCLDAPYNPRMISDSAKRKLKAAMKKHGLVAPVTWNRRTGNIVGGHQRLHQLDSLAGTNDYNFEVAVIDVDEIREKEINLLLNNPDAQGQWDMGKLGDILKLPEIDLSGAGFDTADVFQLFGDNIRRAGDQQDINNLSEELTKMREVFESAARANTDINFYVVLVFKDANEVDRFLDRYKLPDNRYQSGEQIDAIMRSGQPDEQANSTTPSAPSKE